MKDLAGSWCYAISRSPGPFPMKTPPDPLDPLLDRWAQVPEPSNRLTADVWQRIATHEEAQPQGWHHLLESWFSRPAFAVGFIAACALLGLFLAELRVSHQQRERSTQLVRSYLLLIDPLLNSTPEDHRS
jgi:hypothetical protein